MQDRRPWAPKKSSVRLEEPMLGSRIVVECGTHSGRVEVLSQLLDRRRGDPSVVLRKVTQEGGSSPRVVAAASGVEGNRRRDRELFSLG